MHLNSTLVFAFAQHMADEKSRPAEKCNVHRAILRATDRIPVAPEMAPSCSMIFDAPHTAP